MKIPVALARQALVAKKNSPTILFGTGVVGMVSSTVLACRATLKLEEVLERADRDRSTAHTIAVDEPEQYTDSDLKKDLVLIQVRALVSVARLYGPSAIIGVASIAALTKSHNILNDRVSAVTAAYAALDSAFTTYRERVVEKYGEDADSQLRFPREKVREINPETGREHTVEVVGKNLNGSEYARFFDETSNSWQPESEYNLVFLMNQQCWFNDKLRMRGHVFLNEVYDALGIPRSNAGSVVGWVISKDGDNFIDFGIFDAEDAVKRMFVNGQEKSILLDFNVDGVIWDKINDTPQGVMM